MQATKISKDISGLNDLPKLASPAMRALSSIGVTNLRDLTKFREEEIKELHGIGPNALVTLKKKLKEYGLSFVIKKQMV